MTHQIYAIECRDDIAGTSTLCEVEQGVCYYLGEFAPMRRRAARWNAMSKRKGWGTQYRAVPLPYTTSIPDWFDYA
jgi:hypothetical protein